MISRVELGRDRAANIDFGTFQFKMPKGMEDMPMSDFKDISKPEEIVDFFPYSSACHAKFTYVNEDFVEETIPYPEVIQLMIDNGWKCGRRRRGL